MSILTLGMILGFAAVTFVAALQFVWPRSRSVAIGIIAGLPVVTSNVVIRQLTGRSATPELEVMVSWTLAVVVLFAPWLAGSLAALLFHRAGHPGASAVVLGAAAIVYAGWLWVSLVEPIYELTGTCVAPASQVVAVGGDGRSEECDLPPG